MNYKIALSAAFFAAVGLTGCDSRYDNDRADTRAAVAPANLNDGQNNRLGSGDEEISDMRDTNLAREERMRDRKVAPTYDNSSGVTTEDRDDIDVYHSDNAAVSDDSIDDTAAVEDDEVLSGSTSEPMDDTKVSYSQTDLSGGMADERNLRYGLIGNGTGMGLEDATSKGLTDNHTLSDPKIGNHALASSGALSAPTDDQDALKDIKSGTSFEPENYYIEDELD